MNKSMSFISSVIKDLDKAQEKLLDKAAAHVRKKMKEKVSQRHTSKAGDPPGRQTGDLIKGIKFIREGSDKRLVGVGRPASHAHLLEFGTVPRTVKNYQGKKGVRVAVGRVLPRPFMQPTFEEEKGTVEKILSETWV